jgi:hypothetical protein
VAVAVTVEVDRERALRMVTGPQGGDHASQGMTDERPAT